MYRGYQSNSINEPRERSRDERSSKDRNYYQQPNSTMMYDNYGRPIPINSNINSGSSGSYNHLSNKKRVKFEDVEDIRVFKKEDEPAAKGLTEDQILEVKLKFEKEIAKTYDYNWDQKKHFDALSQQNSIKEQKQKQKQLYEKLMSMKQEISFYPPQPLDLPQEVVTANQIQAVDSIQKQAHSQRTSDVLGCYYTTVNQIPNQPTFQVTTANNKNQPKIIKFNPAGINQSQQFMSKTSKNQKQLKSILKVVSQKRGASTSETRNSFNKTQPPRQINPKLIFFLKDMQINKAKYTKEMTEAILKPFKESGELDYLLKNQNLLNQLLKAPLPSNNIGQITNTPSNSNISSYQQSIQNQNSQQQANQNRSSISPSPHNQLKPYFSGQQNRGSIGPRNDKFKTIPCKYFHSHQGCVKTQNCTFIHDERYAGVPTPSMSNYIPNMSSGYGSSQPPVYNSFPNQVAAQQNTGMQSTQYTSNYNQKQYQPNSQGFNNNFQGINYQSSYNSQNYPGQGYNTNPQQGYQQNNQNYYSQGYMNKGPTSSGQYPPGQYPPSSQQYGMYNNQNNQYRINPNNSNQANNNQ